MREPVAAKPFRGNLNHGNRNRGGFIRQGGFTIAELLVAMAILSMITLMCTQLFNMMSKTWQLEERKSDVFINARVALDFMAREMSMATAAYNDNRVRSANGPLTMWYKVGSSASGTSPYQAYADQVYFVAPLASTSSTTDLAEVGYYVYHDTSNNLNRYRLMRRFIPPGDVNGFWSIWNASSTPTFPPNLTWYNTPAMGTPANGNPSPDVCIADNVWSLQMLCYGKQGHISSNGSTDGAAPYNWDGTPGASPAYQTGSPAGTNTAATLPETVQITIQVYDMRTAQQVKLFGVTPSSGTWGTVVGPGTRTFSTFVMIPAETSNFPDALSN